MAYRSGCHTTFGFAVLRFIIASISSGRPSVGIKYQYKVLHGEVRLRLREIIKQVCDEMDVTIVNGALSRDHVHMFVQIPPHVSVSHFVRRANTARRQSNEL